MKTSISMSSPRIHASIGPDVKCGSGCPPGTDCIGSQTSRSPPFQISQTSVREKDAPGLISTSFKGNKERSLESPVMKGSLPKRGSSADKSPHKTFQVLLGGFLISKEPSSLPWWFHPWVRQYSSPRCPKGN